MQASMQRVTAFKASPTAVRPGRSTLTILCNKRVQKKQKVILLQDVEKLGSQGELMSVPVGFWRNYLQPNAIAKVASERILEELRKKKEDALRSKLQEKADAQALANAFSSIGKFVIKKKAGDKDQLFSSVTKQDITDAIYQQMGQDITKYELDIPDIKTLGTFQCTLKVHPEVTGVFSVVIQKEKNVQAKKR
eukprot:gene7255-7468_t